jgi:hypothetical protein
MTTNDPEYELVDVPVTRKIEVNTVGQIGQPTLPGGPN